MVSGLNPGRRRGCFFSRRSHHQTPQKCGVIAFQNPVCCCPWRYHPCTYVLLPLRNCACPQASAKCSQGRVTWPSGPGTASPPLSGLKDFQDHYPWQLSGGMKQRASPLSGADTISQNCCCWTNPSLALDAFTREDMWELLQRLWEAHPVHQLCWLPTTCGRAIFLSDTRVCHGALAPSHVRSISFKVDLPPPPHPWICGFTEGFHHMYTELRRPHPSCH